NFQLNRVYKRFIRAIAAPIRWAKNGVIVGPRYIKQDCCERVDLRRGENNNLIYITTQNCRLFETSFTSTGDSLASPEPSTTFEASSSLGRSVVCPSVSPLAFSTSSTLSFVASAAGSTSILAPSPDMLAVVVVASAWTHLVGSSSSKLRLATGVLDWSRTRERRFLSIVTGLATIPRKPLKSKRVRFGLSTISFTSSASDVDSGVMAFRLRVEPGAGVRRLSLWISEPTVTFRLDAESFNSVDLR
ncbi:AAEL014812-PA, partial [Aedes aegypti]